MPEISIIIPVYNAEALLKDEVDNILNRTSSNFEQILDVPTEKIEEYISYGCIRELREKGYTTLKGTV